MVNLDWSAALHEEIWTFHPLLHVISLLLWVMSILVKPGPADGVGWVEGAVVVVVEGMDVDAVVMRSGKKNAIG